MSLKTILNQRLTEQFISAKLAGAHNLSPRDGYYFIREVNYQEFRNKGKFPIATVLWKPNIEEPFNKDVSFPISLSALAIGDPLDYLNMANKTIFIHSTTLVEEGEHSKTMQVACKYEIITTRPTFTTAQALVLSGFAGNTSTIAEAQYNYETTTGIDLSEAIYSEAFKDDAYDAADQEDTNSNG